MKAEQHRSWRLWQPVAMPRVRLAVTAAVLLLVVSCLVPCAPFADYAATSLPYQDPTPEMLKKQAAEIAAAEHRLAIHAAIAGVLAVLGLAALIYAWKNRRPRKADPET
jgi:hypothetical protein